MRNNTELQKDVQDAIRIAYKARGVWELDNMLIIDYDYELIDA